MQRSALCRSRRELSNEYLLTKFGFDTAENEPCKVCSLSAYRSPRFDGVSLVFGVDYQVQIWRPDEAADEYRKKGVDIKDVPFKNRSEWEKAVKFVTPLKNDILTAIPENYFIGSAPGHPITRRVFDEMRTTMFILISS